MKKSHCQALEKIKGSSQQIIRIKAQIRKIAAHARLPVLITGETGTGKELVANALHACSDRHANPLVKINCSAIPENLIESQLFGHCKGAFTGATEAQTGLVEEAHTGTLFLDEIGELPMPMQAKLLRFLENASFRRLGDVQEKQVDVWIIAATNRNLKDCFQTKEFRKDLYYRLHGIEIFLPPLRERANDIPLLIDYFCQEFKNLGYEQHRFISKGLKNQMEKYEWPGNIRELKHIINEFYVIGDCSKMEENPALTAIRNPAQSVELPKKTLREVEVYHIAHVLKITGYKIRETANILGIDRNTLKKKIRDYDIKVKIS